VRKVQPKVYLIAEPQVDPGELGDYLDSVGAPEWVTDHYDEYHTDGETLVEVGGRLCYRSWKPGLNVNVSKIREDSKDYLGNILKAGHGSVLEHANYSFIFQNVSRVLTHEMVRHRAGVAVSQESMRYVRLTDLPFWFPDWAWEDKELAMRAVDLLQQMEVFQGWMSVHFGLDDPSVPFAEKKHKTSFMRRFAPHGVTTDMLVTINIRALRHIVYMRTALGAEEEIRIVCDQVAQKALEAFPNLMQDYSPNEHREWIPEFLKV
jgi:thymidylate synthase (FAD)